jgi:hypothetical protein
MTNGNGCATTSTLSKPRDTADWSTRYLTDVPHVLNQARDRSSPVQCDDPQAKCPDIGRDVGIGLPGKQLALLKAIATKTTHYVVLDLMPGEARDELQEAGLMGVKEGTSRFQNVS